MEKVDLSVHESLRGGWEFRLGSEETRIRGAKVCWGGEGGEAVSLQQAGQGVKQ